MVQLPPPVLLTCSDEPDAPDLPGRELQSERDRMTFEYLLSLRSAWGDCKAKLAGVKTWADELGKN